MIIYYPHEIKKGDKKIGKFQDIFDEALVALGISGTNYVKIVPEIKNGDVVLGTTSFDVDQPIEILISRSAFHRFYINNKKSEEKTLKELIRTIRHEWRHKLQLLKLKKYLGSRKIVCDFVEKLQNSYSYFYNPLEMDARKYEYGETEYDLEQFILNMIKTH